MIIRAKKFMLQVTSDRAMSLELGGSILDVLWGLISMIKEMPLTFLDVIKSSYDLLYVCASEALQK